MIKTADTYNTRIIGRLPIQKKAGRKKRGQPDYIDCVTAFDIETTLIKKYKQSVLYHWQFQIKTTTITGRTWEDFRRLYDRLQESIPDETMLVCYVHNLSYEFQFLKSIIPVDSVFAMDKRKILKFCSGKIEFRCSYLWTNQSLDRFLKSMDVRNKKIKGFDYSKKRYPWTPLNKAELQYCINDVKGLTQAIIKKLKADGDNLYTVPLTSTGYSRRLAKEALKGYRRIIWRWIPSDVAIFRAMRDEFRGGDTHAHRKNANRLLRIGMYGVEEMGGMDISSSYPAQLMREKFPKEFIPAEPQYLIDYINYGKACLFYISFDNIRLKNDDFGDPYLSKAKCTNIVDPTYDNGRILKAQALRTCLNEIDFAIVAAEYDFDGYICEQLWIAQKAYLPERFRELIMDTYRAKTELKGVAGREYEYNHAKALFNSYYGMAVQNPCKPDYNYDPATGLLNEDLSRSEEELLAKYKKNGWFPYQVGVWCTSYARLQLHRGIHCVDPLDFLYCDTDSVKYMGNYDQAFKKLNKEYRNKEYSAVDPSGERHYLGVYENDASYLAFKTLGAKKYAYEDMEGKLHITISGVNKQLGAEELGSIENFKEGFIFRKAGGTESIYNDDPEIKEIRIQGHKLQITSNIAIMDSTYTLGLAMDYRRLLAFLNASDIRYSLHYER